MNRIFSLMMVAIMSIGSIQACAKKIAQPLATTPFTIIVMDTTQALLSNAQVKIGKTTYKTSFDGRIVLKPEQISGTRSLTVVCDGYESRKLILDGSPLALVSLIPKPKKEGKSDKRGEIMYLTLGSGRDICYDKPILTKAATADYSADGLAYEEAESPKISPVCGATANNISAGKLTAGEVNDFAKWNLWPNLIDGSHKQFVQSWRIEPRERYTVQVVDKHGYPVVNYPVNLTDIHGNTVFQALTDNTGKAELWNGLLGNKAEVNQPAWQTIVVDEPCDVPEAVDVMFVFDATGSMGDELRYLQAEMKDVISRAKEATGGLDIRTGAVVYRDHGDEYLTRISRLTNNIKTTQAFIDKQEANGGGDYEEAVPEALMAALNSGGWDSNTRARIAFLILDAPCHQNSSTLALLHEQILNAAAFGVRLVPVVCSGLGESGEFLLRAMALATNGTSFFLTDDSGIGNPHLKPTTDSMHVEHLNDMLVRTIVEFSYMPDCTGHWHPDEIENIQEQFIPNPFSMQELEQDPTIPHGPTTLYLLDVTGKLIRIFEGNLSEMSDAQLSKLSIQLSTGVYFVKAFYNGEWYTKKILVH